MHRILFLALSSCVVAPIDSPTFFSDQEAAASEAARVDADTTVPSGQPMPSGAVTAADPALVRHPTGCAMGSAGSWEKMNLPEGTYVPSFAFDPKDNSVVYVGTSKAGIFKTTDCGTNWTKINTGRSADDLDAGQQWTMAIDPTDGDVLYTNSGYGHVGPNGRATNGVYKSTNGGVDWDQILPGHVAAAFYDGGFVARIVIDPTHHEHLVILPHFTCIIGKHHDPEDKTKTGPFVEVTDEHCLLETENGGLSWNVLNGSPSSEEGTGMAIIDHDTWLWLTGFGGMYRTTNKGVDWHPTDMPGEYAYEGYYQSPDGTFFVPAASSVMSSIDGETWKLVTGSPGSSVLSGSATHIYSSQGSCPVEPKPENARKRFSYALVSDPTQWHELDSPLFADGSNMMKYDYDHHMLYTANCYEGLWRMRAQ